jgi:hypothetical protein
MRSHTCARGQADGSANQPDPEHRHLHGAPAFTRR